MNYPLPLMFLFLVLMFANSNSLNAQEISDSIKIETASPITLPDLNHSPKKAALYSALLPGLGQAYNKKYWKLPILYAGFGTLTYFIIDNQKNYVTYRDAYSKRLDNNLNNDTDFPQYSAENLRLIKNMYWKDRDLSIILMGALYTLNVLDAVVDAHFFTYDISNDLSLNLKPQVQIYSPYSKTASTGICLTLHF